MPASCRLQVYKKSHDDLAALGYSNAEIIDILSTGDTFEDDIKTAIDEGLPANYMNTLLTSNKTSDTVAATLLEIRTPSYILLQGLNKDAMTKIGEYKREPGGAIPAWVYLPGEFNDKTAVEKPEYFLQYVQANNPAAIRFVNEIIADSKKPTGDPSTVIAMVNLWGSTEEGGFGTGLVKETKDILKNNAELNKIYTDYYKDYRNVKKDEIVIDAIYGSMTWKNGLGDVNDNTKFDVVDGAGRVWTQQKDGTWEYDTDFVAEYKPADGYGTVYKLNRVQYAKLLASGELDGKTSDQNDETFEKLGLTKNKETDYNNKAWWTCVGTMCEAADDMEMEGGGGGGGSGSGGYTPKATEPEKETEVLYIECNVANAGVWNKETGSQIGGVNTSLVMKKGAYTIQVKAEGYITRELPVTIGAFPTSKTINLVKQGPSISTFIRGIGGIQNLTKTKYLYLFCMWKMRMTSIYTWKQFADSIDSVEQSAFPSLITKEDVLYVYYLVNGNISSAQALVDAGQVTLLDAEGGGTNKIEPAIIGSSGGI